jgi:hypothetical protein
VTIAEFRMLMEDTLTPLGLEVGNVEVSPHLNEKNVELWAHSGCHYYVSPRFLELPTPEAKFGILHEVGLSPTPHPHEKKLRVIQATFYAVFFLLLGFSYDWVKSARSLCFMIAGLLQIPINRFERMKDAELLEQNVNQLGDPIAARTYLEKVSGQVYPKKILSPKSWFRRHPIRNYLRFGKDERLKAILKSDLVHPVAGRSEP